MKPFISMWLTSLQTLNVIENLVVMIIKNINFRPLLILIWAEEAQPW